MERIYSINNYIVQNKNKFFLFFLFDFLYSRISSIVVSLIDPTVFANSINEKSMGAIILLAVIIGPIIETLIHQVIVIEFFMYFKVRKGYILFISAALFALSHNYNWIYVTAMLIPGAIYAYYYLIERPKGIWRAFILVFLLHAVSNFIASAINQILLTYFR